MQTELNSVNKNWETMLAALADGSRLLIINELLKSESSVNDLADNLRIQTYNISKHLKVLEETGLVIKRKCGLKRIYKISEALHSHSSQSRRVLDLGCCTFVFSCNSDSGRLGETR